MLSNQFFSKIWIIITLVVIIAGGILAYQYWQVSEEKIKLFEVVEEKESIIQNFKNQITELENRISELEEQNSEQGAKINELQTLVAKLKGEEAGIKINREFIILGSPSQRREIRKEVKMIIESVERIESIEYLEPSTLALNIRKQPDEIFVIVNGKLTNKEKTTLYVDPEDWLRLFDAEKEELYAPKVYWAYHIATAEATTKFRSPVVFVISRTATNLYLRVTDAFGTGTPIELEF